ncbi:hypothetical protein C0Q70_02185 [Pomacea canaliculata]|uniref:DnaJ homolog subfamily C member 10 n=1 Tax=Pomacea canaliculata TaxID=400727 RepID=A0A2T7Q1M0_POMCA|nr:hypothetical protein C0Q70_02185 [Pomacea canaliculata]
MPVGMLQIGCILCILVTPAILAADDFYQLLGVDKSASTKEIRKAFKKLAISAHPDKNTGDPDAHNKFVRISRAYEVLKDEDLRKKYDLHGEAGLNDDARRGRQYESWQWYQQNFGIYDDDPEIITLSKSDFELSVEGTDDVWFINFYSPHCSHCHELAPAWREMARELEGVIRVGAVNCEDDWQLCRMQGINSYPSLQMYPKRERYNGERTVSALVKHAMSAISARYQTLTKGTFESVIGKDTSGRPWLLTFCGEGDCLEHKSSLKLAAILEDLVHVGMVDCDKESSLCKKLGHKHGNYFFSSSDEITNGNGMEIDSLEVKEVASKVLYQLPDVTNLDKDTFKAILDKMKWGQEKAWLLHFVDSSHSNNLELRKLPAMITNIKVGRVNCAELPEECLKLHIQKFPTFVIFKQDGGAEVYYGRVTAHDVAAFAQDSTVTPMTTLDPSDFPNRVVLSRDPWFVDFFAPYNIHSYPTTIFYNQTVPHQFTGQHNAHDLVEFIKDTLSPPVISLNFETFYQLVGNKRSDEIWAVDFFAPWCGPCMQLAPEWRRLAKMLQKTTSYVHVAQVNCQEHQHLCQREGIHSYPSMRLYPMGVGTSFFVYNGWNRDAHSLQAWVYEFVPSRVESLSWQTFPTQVLDSSQPWIVDFYAPWCGHCQVFKPEFERVAEMLEGQVRAGKVDCDQHRHLCTQAGVNAYPSVRFYPGSTSPHVRQHPYGWQIESQNAEQIVAFVRKNMRQPQGRDEL